MSHLILLLTFVISLAKVHGQDVPDYGLFLQDEPIFQDPEISNGELVYDDSTDLFTDDLAANPSNNCLSYDDVDNVFLSDVARIRPRREKCANPDAPQLTPPTNIYDSNGMLNLLSPPAKSPVISGPEKDPNYQDLERLFGLQLPGPTQKDPNTDCPADLYRDSRIPVCQLGSFQRDVELLLGDIYATVYDVRIASSLADCVNVASAWCCAIVRSAHHPLDPEGEPDVLTGYRCFSPTTMQWISEINRLSPDGYSVEEFFEGQQPFEKRLGEDP